MLFLHYDFRFCYPCYANPCIFVYCFINTAQELLNDWVNTKLKLELVSDQEDDSDKLAARSVLPQDIPVGFQKYEKFDGKNLT